MRNLALTCILSSSLSGCTHMAPPPPLTVSNGCFGDTVNVSYWVDPNLGNTAQLYLLPPNRSSSYLLKNLEMTKAGVATTSFLLQERYGEIVLTADQGYVLVLKQGAATEETAVAHLCEQAPQR